MIKTAANILKGAFRQRQRKKSQFRKISWLQEKILKHQEDHSIKHFSIDSLNFYYKRPYELLFSYREIFQREIYRFNTPASAPLIIDCGSNIGLSVIYFKQLFSTARIIAFEPDQQNFDLLKKNIEVNNLKGIDLNKAAVWVTDGEISFENAQSESSRIISSENGRKVSSLRLNTFLKEFQHIDFLKIDIEGAEYEVISDCRNSLGKVNHLFLEYHGRVEDTDKLQELLYIIKEAGFLVYIRNAADNLEHPFQHKRTGTIYDVQLNIFCYK